MSYDEGIATILVALSWIYGHSQNLVKTVQIDPMIEVKFPKTFALVEQEANMCILAQLCCWHVITTGCC